MAVPLEILSSPRSHFNFSLKGCSGTGMVCGPGGQQSLMGCDGFNWT